MGDFADEKRDHRLWISTYLWDESGPGKSNGWDWGTDFPDARARWIAAEVDLFRERAGLKTKDRARSNRVDLIHYWEEHGKEELIIGFNDGASLRLKLTQLCGTGNTPSSILMEIQLPISEPGRSPRFRTNYSPEYHVVGHPVRKANKMRIERSLRLGECR